jgi:hypothetical protein
MSNRCHKCLEQILVVAALLVLTALVLLPTPGVRQKVTTVHIGSNGTARLGNVLPLRNKLVRDISLKSATAGNGGKLAIVADQGASIKNVVEVMNSIAGPKTNTRPELP